MKIIGAILVIISLGVIGLTIAGNYRQRFKDLQGMRSALQLLETEIIYASTPMAEAFARVATRSASQLAIFFQGVREKLLLGDGITAGEAWVEALYAVNSGLTFKNQDLEALKAFGVNLGVTDKEEQLKYFRVIQQQLQHAEKLAEEAAVKNEKMWRQLGFLGGVFIVLVIY